MDFFRVALTYNLERLPVAEKRPGGVLLFGMVLITVIQVDVGERDFGTSAGYGELLLTK